MPAGSVVGDSDEDAPFASELVADYKKGIGMFAGRGKITKHGSETTWRHMAERELPDLNFPNTVRYPVSCGMKCKFDYTAHESAFRDAFNSAIELVIAAGSPKGKVSGCAAGDVACTGFQRTPEGTPKTANNSSAPPAWPLENF